MSATWTLKSKVLDELQLAQRRITSAGNALTEITTEYERERNRAGAREHAQLGMVVTTLIIDLGVCAKTTMILLTMNVNGPIIERLRSLWGRLADSLNRDITRDSISVLEQQLHEIGTHVCRAALSINADLDARQFSELAKRVAQRSRN